MYFRHYSKQARRYKDFKAPVLVFLHTLKRKLDTLNCHCIIHTLGIKNLIIELLSSEKIFCPATLLLLLLDSIKSSLQCSKVEDTDSSVSSSLAVTRASCEGSEDPGWGRHVSDREESPGVNVPSQLLQR